MPCICLLSARTTLLCTRPERWAYLFSAGVGPMGYPSERSRNKLRPSTIIARRTASRVLLALELQAVSMRVSTSER